jgi:hypothetical protein
MSSCQLGPTTNQPSLMQWHVVHSILRYPIFLRGRLKIFSAKKTASDTQHYKRKNTRGPNWIKDRIIWGEFIHRVFKITFILEIF